MAQGGWRGRDVALGLMVTALALASSGCLFVAAGAAAGAAGYAYYRGKVTRTYDASFDDVWAATNSSLVELGLPVVSAKREKDHATIRSKVQDDGIEITLEPQQGRIPADGPRTQVGVRVATFGDGEVSNRLLDQISFHLVPAAGPPPPTAPPPVPVPPQSPPPSVETGAPPLAP